MEYKLNDYLYSYIKNDPNRVAWHDFKNARKHFAE